MPERLGGRLRAMPAWTGQVIRFGITGGLGFVIDAGVLWLLIRAGVSPYAARVASIACAIVLTWWLNRRMTFRTAAPPSWREFGAFFLQSLAGAAVNYAIYSAMLWAGAPVIAGLVVGTAIASVFNFFRYRAILS
ncbi:MAG: GtrA family protein [Janthinobacterium lividum]